MNFNKNIRNIAVVAHVDHGKTTMVDTILKQNTNIEEHESMDSKDLERERGITILAKCTSIFYKTYKINFVDTPGHSDFSGEVERVMNMVDGVLLIVDAAEGVMPQTKFVLSKAIKMEKKIIIFINKIDKTNARPMEMANETLNLLLGFNPVDFDNPIFYGSGRAGFCSENLEEKTNNMNSLLDKIIEYIPAPSYEDQFSFLVSMIDIHPYCGNMLIGKINGGKVNVGDIVKSINQQNQLVEKFTIKRLIYFHGMKKKETTFLEGGDIGALVGGTQTTVNDTVGKENEEFKVLPAPHIENPTLAVLFMPNISPLAGRDGSKLTIKQIKKRLFDEAATNVGIKVNSNGDTVEVMVRGELQLAILIENLRREGFEFIIKAPTVVTQDGKEPCEELTIDVDIEYKDNIKIYLTNRGAVVLDEIYSDERVRVIMNIASRALIGTHNDLILMSRGTAIINKRSIDYGSCKYEEPPQKGRMIAMEAGITTAYAANKLEERGNLFVEPGMQVYVGSIVGQSSKEGDMQVNPVKSKELSNQRSSGKDENIKLEPSIKITVDNVFSYLRNTDEAAEITPKRVCLFILKS